jgi:tetratricopeptide (TPR) repeat protein
LSITKDHSKAVQILKDGIKYNKNSAALYFALGHEYRFLQRYDDAVDVYLRSAKIDEVKCKDAYRFVGLIYYNQKDEKKAKKYFEIYIKAGGKDPKVIQILKKIP